MSKNVLILERSSNPIDFKIDKGNYILEGVFTEIGVRNRNNRIYEESEFVPHVNGLQQKIKTSTLLGELDHPAGYEISLKNVSHVIEKLEYNQSTKKVMGRIKILDTTAGKEVKALMDGGIPIHISSRAAGVVESNGKVKLKQLFTYDIVADPGFENAQLSRINESCGFNENDNIQIFDMGDEKIPMLKENTNDTKMTNTKTDLVTISMIDDYSKEVVNEMKKLESKINSNSDTTSLEKKVNQLIKHNNYLAEQLEKSIKYSEYVAEKTGQIIDYTENEIAEKLKSSIKYSEYLGEQLQKRGDYQDYVVEEVSKRNAYQDYLAEKLGQSIKHSDYIVEEVSKRNSYQDYLAEQLENSIKHNDHIVENFNKFESNFESYSQYLSESVNKRNAYQDYLAEQLDKSIQHSDYLAESLTKTIKYSEYIKENVETGQKYMDYLSESLNEELSGTKFTKNGKSSRLNEYVSLDRLEKLNNTNFDSLDSKLNSILESAKNQVTERTTKYNFMNYLLESQKDKFKNLDEISRQKVISGYEMYKFASPREAQILFESFVSTEKEIPLWEQEMPAKYYGVWSSLTESQKDVIRSQASLRVLDKPHQINHFWMTRDLRMFERQNSGLTNKNSTLINESNQNKNNSFISNVEKELNRRFGKN